MGANINLATVWQRHSHPKKSFLPPIENRCPRRWGRHARVRRSP